MYHIFTIYTKEEIDMGSKTTLSSLLFVLGLLVYFILFAFYNNYIFIITNMVISTYMFVIIMIAFYKDIQFDCIPKDTVVASSQGVEEDESSGISKTTYSYIYQGIESIYTCSDQEVKLRLNLQQVTLEISKIDPSNIRISRDRIRRKKYWIMGGLCVLSLWLLIQSVIRIMS